MQRLCLMKLDQIRIFDYVIEYLHRSFHLLLAGHVIHLHLGLHDGVLLQHILVLEVSLKIAAINQASQLTLVKIFQTTLLGEIRVHFLLSHTAIAGGHWDLIEGLMRQVLFGHVYLMIVVIIYLSNR